MNFGSVVNFALVVLTAFQLTARHHARRGREVQRPQPQRHRVGDETICHNQPGDFVAGRVNDGLRAMLKEISRMPHVPKPK